MLQGRMENKKLRDKMDRTYYSDFLMEKAVQDKLSMDATARLASDIVIAGFDTSAVTVSYVLLLLAMYPEHQEAVYQEQLDILGDDPEVVPTWEQLSKMEYLTRVLKEVLRHYGSPCVFRKLTNDIELDKMDRTYYSDFLMEKAIQDKLSMDATARLASDIVIAGFDTSAVTVSYVLLLLAMYPEHQEAVYQEQLDILGDDPEVVPTWEQLSKMEYLTRVLKEVLRHYGSPCVFRKLTNDIELDKFKLPKGASVCLAFHVMHRNESFWSHPNEFYPDHFLPEECAKRPKDCFFPFSWGPRSCPGRAYAMAVNKIPISTVIRKYKLETDLKLEELTYKFSFLVEVNSGYLIRIKQRIQENN